MRSNSRKHSQNETQQVLLRPQEELERVLAALVTMSHRIGKPFSEARMQQLSDDLASYRVAAIEWALDCWSRNSKVLPALADLLQLLRTWQAENIAEENCDCSHLHGTGYGVEDIRWLMRRRGQHAERFSIAQWEELFAELDKKRQGGAPNWRKSPEGKNFLRAE